tara:strand:- start:117 stop:569 length:453 start_codon:yes stop_codon:yes gene_type:complete
MTEKLAKQTLIILCMLMLTACSALKSQTDTQKSMALFTKAQQAYQVGLLEEAEADFIKITKLTPEFYEAWLRLGNIYVRTGQLKAAERMFEKSARINPKEYKAWNNLAVTYIKQAIAVLKEGKEHMAPGSEEGMHAEEMATRLINAITQP